MPTIAKRSEIKDFTNGNLVLHLVKFAIPVMLANLMMILLNTVDMIVVSWELGEAGTSAVSIGGSVATFINAFVNGFCAAAQILVARMVGAGERSRISKFVGMSFGFLFFSGIIVMGVMLPLTDTVLGLLNTPTEAYAGAREYSIICLIGIIPIFAYHIISSVVRGMGDSKHPFMFIAVACGLNIVLDFLFVSVFKMGVGGAAIATVIAQLVSVLFSIALLIKEREAFELKLKFADLVKWESSHFSSFLKLGIPMALNNSAIQISAMIIGSMTNDYGVSVSAFAGISATVNTSITLILVAISTSSSMIIGQNLAAGKLKRVNKTLLLTGYITVSISILFIIAFVLFPKQLFGIFTTEESVLAIVPSYLPILALNLVASGISPVTHSLINGSGNGKINLLTALLDAIVARIGFAVLFGVVLEWGYVGFWLGAALAAYVPILIGIGFYVSGVWRRGVVVK